MPPRSAKTEAAEYVAVGFIAHGHGEDDHDELSPGDVLDTSHFTQEQIAALLAKGAIEAA